MAETSLITISDIQAYRAIDPKFNQTRFTAFVMEVQRKNLRGLLGDALYFDLFATDPMPAKYTTLVDGGVYNYQGRTVQYYGLIPALCYWWLAVATREGDMFHSGYGAIQFVNNEQQHFETAKEKERIAASYMETAQGYVNDIVKFLNTNKAEYPLWISGNENEQVTKFVMFKL